MPYSFLEHTADVGVEVTAASLEKLFVESLRALTDCITRVERVGRVESRRVVVSASDLERLMVAWLSEVIFLHETEGLVLAEAEAEIVGSDDGWSLIGKVEGELFEPERHGLKTLVKAVTYHQLRVHRQNEIWQARVIFDI